MEEAVARLYRQKMLAKAPYGKNYLEPSELVKVLKKEDLRVDDDELAEWWIRTVGYFHLKGYLACLQETKSPRRYRKGSRFSHATDLLLWERELRSLLLEQVGNVELRLRAAIVETIGQGSGDGYLDDENFDVRALKNRTLTKDYQDPPRNEWDYFLDSFDRNLRMFEEERTLPFIEKFRSQRKGERIPLWILLEGFTFGDVVELYRVLAAPHRERIASTFANPSTADGELSEKELLRILVALKEFRNIAAHYHVFLDKRYNFKRPTREREAMAASPYFPNIAERRSTYDIVLILLYLSPTLENESTWAMRVHECLESFPKGIPGVNLQTFGAPKNWSRRAPWVEESTPPPASSPGTRKKADAGIRGRIRENKRQKFKDRRFQEEAARAAKREKKG